MGVTAYSFFHCPEQDIKRLKFICKGGINLKFFRFMPCFEANGVGGAGGEGTTELTLVVRELQNLTLMILNVYLKQDLTRLWKKNARKMRNFKRTRKDEA